MEGLIAVCLFVLGLFVVVLWRRLGELESQRERDAGPGRDQLQLQLNALAARILLLEKELAKQQAAASGVEVVPPPTPAAEPPPIPVVALQPAPEPLAPPVQRPVFNPEPQPRHEPSSAATFKNTEWEVLVGGSVLNKLGALVIVVGLGLFLAYSFAYMGPVGRATISAVLSAALLGAGIRVERKPRFRTFSYGLIGAGWAGLYATAYAMYALPAARVIADPSVGSVILLLTGAAMVFHSLRYKVQTITSIAFFTPFAALAVTPSTPFALISLVPLAVALLYLSWRLAWYRMALFGLAATWGTCFARGVPAGPLASSESLLLAYWLLFEAFDLLRQRRNVADPLLQLLMPLNAISFIALSYAAWQAQAPNHLWIGAALGAVLFLASAFARVEMGGRYEGAVALAAALGGLAILGRAENVWAAATLAAEAEILFLTGRRFRLNFVRALGLAAFAVSLIDAAFAFTLGSQVVLLGVHVQHITPVLLLHIILFYVNRRLWRTGWYFSSAAALLVCVVFVQEISNGYVGLAFAVFALVLYEIDRRLAPSEFRVQFFLVAALSLILQTGFHWNDLHRLAPISAPLSPWLTSILMAVVCWWIAWSTWRSTVQGARENARLRDISAAAGSALMFAALWMVLPFGVVALASLMIGMAWSELGIAASVPSFEILGTFLISAASVELCATDASIGGKAIWLLNGIPFLAGLFLSWFRSRNMFVARLILSLLALIVLTLVVYIEIGSRYRTVVWAMEGVGLLAAGLTLRERTLRLEGLFLLLACILKVFFYDLRNLETIYRILSFIALGIILLAVSWAYTRFRERLQHYL
ncbi:MAG: DUF2339 domain-containing protein [Bryobacteraceae bacterium]